MGRKLNLSHLTEEECERILHVLQKDFEVRHAEKERLGSIENILKTEQNKTQVLSQQGKFNRNCCIRCCQVFGLIFNRRRQCYLCGYNVCKDCCNYQADSKNYVCHHCQQEKELNRQSCSWFYNTVGHKFRRFGSAKVVRSLYKSTSYSDTEADRGPEASRSFNISSKKARPRIPDLFRDDGGKIEDVGADDDDEECEDELPFTSATSSTPRSADSSHLVSRAGSLDSLHLPPTSSSSSSSSRQPKIRTPDRSKSLRASDLGRPGVQEPKRPRAKWDDEAHTKGKVKKERKDTIYKHAFENALQAEEHKFKAKFEVLLNDLHRTLDSQSPHGLTDSFASTSYGEVMLSFRARVKDLVIGLSQRLNLAFESFDSCDSPEDHTQEVKQKVSRFLEDLLGESIDLTSDEAVSDLSSLSDDSGNNRHVFEDQIAQAVVSKILDNHRREVHHTLHQDSHSRHLTSPVLVPEALRDDDNEDGNDNDDANEDEGRSRHSEDVDVKDTDISKDFEDLKNFVQETQSRSRQLDDCSYGSDSLSGAGEVGESGEEVLGRASPRAGSSFDTHVKNRDFPPLPDFSQFEQIDFNSNEVDPDYIQMNLAVIPEETEEELEEDEASDTHWRENWIFKGLAPSAQDNASKKRLRGDYDQPQYMMVPQPDDDLAPRVGNKDVDQLSDLSDNDDMTDDDNSFYPRTSEELARISRHKRSTTPPSFTSPSLIPTLDSFDTHHPDPYSLEDSLQSDKSSPRQLSKGVGLELDYEDVSVGTDDFVGPIVEKTHKELKLLEDLIPAEEDDPKFVVAPESVTIQEGEPVKFWCRVSGTQPIDVFWYREQDAVEELEQGEDVDLQVEGDRHQVTLYNLTREQAGQYMCIALSDKGKAIKYLTVTVKDNKQELKKPEFLKELKDVDVLEGQSVKFRCKVKGYPQPRINWYKDGKLLKSNRSCRIEKFGNRDYILTVDYATMDDDAEYMVVAKNVAGEVKSTAQVIVEPYAEGHPLLSRHSRSLSISTVNTDSESDRPSSVLLEDYMDHSLTSSRENLTSPFRSLLRENSRDKVDTLVNKMDSARNTMRQEAESMVVTAEELTILNQHLEDMERHLDNLDGRNSAMSYSGMGHSHDHLHQFPGVDDVTALAMIEDEYAMGQAARNVRKLTSNALSVLRAAEEIIQNEKNASDVMSVPSFVPDNSAEMSSERNNNKTVSPSFAMDHSSLNQCDLNQSVSSGYGTISMASSAVDDNGNDGALTESSVSQSDQPYEDEFALYLPSLDDEGLDSYREEVSISLSSNSSNQSNKIKPSGASSSSSSTLTNSSESSSSSVRTLEPPVASSTARNSSDSDVSDLFAQKQSQLKTHSSPYSSLTMPDQTRASGHDDSIVVNFGPKESNTAAYTRDYEVPGRKKEVEGTERKRWSVTLNPYSPSADVVNKRPSLAETEEQIYLTAGNMFHLEDKVKELQSRVDAEKSSASAHSLSDLEDQVARTAARVARSEKEVSNIERAVNTLQFSPRSSRGSSSSTSSTPRESIDSGVSSFFPERPLPVHMVGHTQEEEMPETRAEYDADSGIELPSVTRLKAMFGTRGKLEDNEGGFKRIHSITARSLSKDQLQKLRESGSSSQEQLQGKSGNPQWRPDEIHPDQPIKTSASIRLNLSQGQQGQQPAIKRQIRSTNLPEPAHYQQLDPSNQPVLIYPEMEGQASSTVSRPKSVVYSSPQPSSMGNTSGCSIARSQSIPSASAVMDEDEMDPKPKIRSGCISARAAFWERRIMQGEATDEHVEEEFPEMVQDSHA